MSEMLRAVNYTTQYLENCYILQMKQINIICSNTPSFPGLEQYNLLVGEHISII